MLNIVTVPTETLAIDQTLELDMYSGISNFTVYIALLRREPLLLASINGYVVRLITSIGLSDPMEVNTVNNKVV